MPNCAEIPGATLATLGADLTVASLPPTQLITLFSPSQSFARYDVAATSATTIQQGDALAVVDAQDSPLVSGIYLGTAQLLNAVKTVGIPGLAAIRLQVNPITGHLMADADGHVHFLSEQELHADRIAVTASITVAGIPISVTAPASQIAEALAAAVQSVPLVGGLTAGLIRGGADTLQSALDSTIITMEFDPEGQLQLSDDAVVPCFAAGTLIATPGGPRRIEDLAAGDLVCAADHGPQAIRWIGRMTLDAARLARHPHLRPIRIRAGALGPGVPDADLLLSPQHRVLIRSAIAARMFGTSEVLLPACRLLAVPGIAVATDILCVTYLHILLDQHDILIANGAGAESLYLGTQARMALGPAAWAEIAAIFPHLCGTTAAAAFARLVPKGRLSQKLLQRHVQNGKALT